MDDSISNGWSRAADGRLVPPSLFDDAERDSLFWKDGFVTVPLPDPDAVANLRAGFADLKPSDGFDPRTLDDPRCSYHCTWLDLDREYRAGSDTLVRRLFDDQIAQLLPGYRILSSNFYVKPPGTGRFEVHQNWPMIAELDIPTLTAWIPLQTTSFQNGTIRMVRGSHHVFPDVAAASSERFFDDWVDELIVQYMEPIEVAAGTALIFDDSMLHWSGDNLSSSPRASLQIEVVPRDVPTVLWVRNPDDPGEFELWSIDDDYWIDYDITSALTRPTGLDLAQRRPNPNRSITLEEFRAAMADAESIRRRTYQLADS
jgi:hypothetical protein